MENTREMKNTHQIVYEYWMEKSFLNLNKLNKLLKNKNYNVIEDLLNIPNGTIKLYDREYKKWIRNKI